MEKPNENQNETSNQNSYESKRKNVIQIPSYEEVYRGGGGGSGSSFDPKPYNSQTPNRPPSFSQAFSFLKSSEFYVAPPEDELIRTASESAPSSSAPPSSAPPSSANDSSLNRNNTVVQNRNAILVSHRQKGNPLLKHIRNVRWVFADIVCDYLLGQSSCALYLSLRYHLLHPDYLYFRIRELQKNFKLRVVLCHVDVEDVVKPLHDVTKTAMLHDCTLLCGWSLEECARYLETIKVYENKSPDLIREHTDTDYLSRLTHALTSVRHVNKTDVITLGSTFGSLSGIMDASMEDLSRCPGIGERKVRRLYETFHEPFRRRVPARSATAEPKAPTEDKCVEESPSAEGSNIDKGKMSGTLDYNKKPLEANKKPEPDVKSALSAAFAKYSDKIKKPKISNSDKEKGEGSGKDI